MKNTYNFSFGTETYSELQDRQHVAVRNMYIDYHLKEVKVVLEFRAENKIEEIKISLAEAEKIGLINWNALREIIKWKKN